MALVVSVFAQPSVLALASALSAGLSGLCLMLAWARQHAAAQRRSRARQEFRSKIAKGTSVSVRVVEYAKDISHRIALGAIVPLLHNAGVSRAKEWLATHAKKAGLGTSVSAAGLIETTVRLGVVLAVVGALVGAVFSTELTALVALAGAVVGVLAPERSILQLKRQRSADLERDLAEMLEVVALGLHSGLSFDRSLSLYTSHFTTQFAKDCSAAQRAWAFGLVTREEALRDLATSYDSALLGRVVENMVRSLRFGSSLAESLEAAAVEARVAHRTHVEERVAKAPVKIMIPTGVFILPAMLLLVLGPVLLELMEGF